MPKQNDFRTKNNDQLTFYVFDDLKRKGDTQIFRYDTTEEAVQCFLSLPENFMSSIGVSIHEYSSVDLVQRINGKPVKVMDYLEMETFKDREDVFSAMTDLQEKLSIAYRFVSGIHPRYSVLASLDMPDVMDSYLKNKVLYVSPKSHSQALFASINELYVEGKGWMEARDFLRRYPDDGKLQGNIPVVRRVNIEYKETDTGYLGQCDISPQEFEQMLKKTKEYTQSFKDKKPAIKQPIKESVDKKILSAKAEREQKLHAKTYEKNYNDRRERP